MKGIFALIGAVFFTWTSFGQAYKKVVVTDFNYFMRDNVPMVNPTAFPFYFSEKQFIIDIQDEVSKQAKSKFSSDTVIFTSPKGIFYSEGTFVPKLTVKNTAKSVHEEGTLYLGIETILQLGISVNNVTTYHFITEITGYNSKGKKVYNFKNIIPFVTIAGDEIVGQVEMAAQDFYNFYFDGMIEAFAGKNKTLEKRYVRRPPDDHYVDFLSTTEQFYLVSESNGYRYGKKPEDAKKVISYKYNFWRSSHGGFHVEGLFSANNIKEGYDVTNVLQNKNYKVKFFAGNHTFFDAVTFSSGLTVELFNDNKVQVGNLSFDDQTGFTGTLNNAEYSIRWNSDYHCDEVYFGDSLTILVNELNDYKVIFLQNTVSEQQLANFFNLIFAYDLSMTILQNSNQQAGE